MWEDHLALSEYRIDERTRGKLRAGFDIASLERLLGALAPEGRDFVLKYCLEHNDDELFVAFPELNRNQPSLLVPSIEQLSFEDPGLQELLQDAIAKRLRNLGYQPPTP